MTSRLASLLVQDGLVSAKKMAEAFQRQVIYGGTLDTILLEMDVLDEQPLIEAMARSSALPIAGDVPAREAIQGAAEWLPLALSERFRAAPLSLDSNVLRVLVTDPVDRVQLDELGYLVGRSIDPVVATEHRFAELVAEVYGVPVPARLASLAARLGKRTRKASMTPREVPRVVEVTRVMEAPPEDEGLPGDTIRTRVIEAELPPDDEPPLRARKATLIGTGVEEPPPRAVVTDVPMPAAPVENIEAREAETPRAAPRQSGAPASQVTGDLAVRVESGSPADAQPLPLDEANQRIDEAADRDAIFETLCRGARSQLAFAAILTVHGETAVGRLALGDAWLAREAVARVAIPLDRPSPFRAAVHGRAPYLGRLGEEQLGAVALEALGRQPPLPALLLPIVLRDRAVALLYADAAGQPIDATLLAGLTTSTAAAARSFQRLILRAKGAEYAKAPAAKSGKLQSAPESPAPDPAPTAATEKKSSWRAAAPAGGDVEAAPAGKPPQRSTVVGIPLLGQAVAVELKARAANSRGGNGNGNGNGNGHAHPQDLHDLPTDKLPARARTSAELDALVEAVLADDAHSAPAADGLIAAGEAGARATVARLPGPLRLARHALKGPTPALAEHGPLLAVIARLGQNAAPALLARANDPSIEVRYYVALALGAVAPDQVAALGKLAFDADASVRRAALDALTCASASPALRTLTESLRGELPGPERARQLHAAEALGALRDVPSVPRLIELVKHHDAQVIAAARRALIEITKQDFGTSRWRWRAWWERHRDEPRVEWMFEGLAHAEPDVRLSASEELKSLSSEYFGYHFDLPRREREEARKKWIDWWRARQGDKGPAQ